MGNLEALLDGTQDVHKDFQRYVNAARRDGPVQQKGSVYWVLGYEAASQILRHPDVGPPVSYAHFFGGGKGNIDLVQSKWIETAPEPQHSPRRRVAHAAIGSPAIAGQVVPHAVSALESSLRELADNSYCGDFAVQVAPGLVDDLVLNLLGLPHEHRGTVRTAIRALGNTVGRPLDGTEDIVIEADEKLGQALECITDCLLDWKELDEGLAKSLAAANEAVEGRPLDAMELASCLINLGFDSELLETTIIWCAFAMASSLATEDVAEIVSSRRRLTPYVWELLRLGTASPLLLRRAAREFDAYDLQIPAQAWIVVYLGAALRDPEEFTRPGAVSLHRKSTPLVFGAGDHTCLGGRLAFVCARQTVATLAASKLRSAGEVGWMRGPYHGLASLPVAIGPA